MRLRFANWHAPAVAPAPCALKSYIMSIQISLTEKAYASIRTLMRQMITCVYIFAERTPPRRKDAQHKRAAHTVSLHRVRHYVRATHEIVLD